jgi:RHS repeat-associated protein
MTPGGERRVRYGYDVRTARCCRYDVAMSQAYLRNSCRLRPGDLVAVSALVPGAHDCELLRLEFTGKERDAETGSRLLRGEVYVGGAGAVYQAPIRIHFQASMLEDPQRFNLYAYVRNNPLRFVDPTGEAIRTPR